MRADCERGRVLTDTITSRRPLSSRSSAAKKTVRSGCGRSYRSLHGRRWRRTRDLNCGDHEVCLGCEFHRVDCKKGGGVKAEKLAFLSNNTKYTDRFARQIGGFCRVMTVHDVA